jgi:hypothetical protein
MEWILELKLEAERPKNQTPKPVLSSIRVWNHNQDFRRKRFPVPLMCKPKTETVLIHSLEPKAKVFSKSQRTIPTQEYISVVAF